MFVLQTDTMLFMLKYKNIAHADTRVLYLKS